MRRTLSHRTTKENADRSDDVVSRRAEVQSRGLDVDALVLKVRRLLSSLWPEIVRLAEALDRDGELVGAGHIKSIVRLPSWLT